jgi:hypothetical protein
MFLTSGLALMLLAATSNVLGQLRPYRITDREVARLLDRIKNKTGGFRGTLKKALNKSRIDRTQREEDINAYVKAFEEDTKRLENHFDHHQSTAADVETVMQRATRINTFMILHPLDVPTQTAWETLRSDLEQLADAYNINWLWSNEWRTPPLVELPYRVDDRQVEQIIRRIESQSDSFRQSLDSALDKSRYDGTRAEDNINQFVKEFYQETKTLHDHFDAHKATAGDVQTVLTRAAQIDQFLRRNQLRNREPQQTWAQLKASLDDLARVYNVSWRWQ